jgi:L-alanine-DL-glutamate epimerase-like enolase superfamily enzyme
VIAGSTRLKAATATKLVLNMLTTGAMVRIGKTYGNLMVDVHTGSEKLKDRARRIVNIVTGIDYDEADRLLKKAHWNVKAAIVMQKTGLISPKALARLRKSHDSMREAIGEDIDLMCDINQLWNVNQAIEVGQRVAPYHLFWLEDVVAHDDYQGLARVADALTTPIAAGEYVYGITPFRQLLENRSVDIVMIDVLRVGGITQWLKVAAMAEAFDLPVVSHLIPEVHVHLVAGIPNGLTVEYMPWTLRLFEETPALENGEIIVPDKPGLGLAFDQEALSRYQVA